MFRGRFEHTIDKKGRLSIPSRFREVLGEGEDSRLVVTYYDQCLSVYPYKEWKILEDKVEQLPAFSRDTRDFLRFFYSRAVDCPIDKLGRILLPQNLRESAMLDRDVVILGTLKRMEIWSKKLWEAAEARVAKEDVGAIFERVGL